MYENPIQETVEKICTQISKQKEEHLMAQVECSIGYRVDREELLKALRYDRDQYEKGYKDALESNKWIPVGERLPELGRRVLCQCRANIYEILKLTVDGWYYDSDHCYMESFVIAWMPLPEPYKVEKER